MKIMVNAIRTVANSTKTKIFEFPSRKEPFYILFLKFFFTLFWIISNRFCLLLSFVEDKTGTNFPQSRRARLPAAVRKSCNRYFGVLLLPLHVIEIKFIYRQPIFFDSFLGYSKWLKPKFISINFIWSSQVAYSFGQHLFIFNIFSILV